MENKCCKPFSRAILLLLVWSGLISFATFGFKTILIRMTWKISYPNYEFAKILPSFYTVPLILLPVAGWVGDSLLGRYRAIVVGFLLSATAYLVLLISFVMLQFNWRVEAFVLMCLSLPAATFGAGTFATNSLPFIIDQMIGASADDISAVVQWYCWAVAVGVLIQNLPVCLILPLFQQHILEFYLALTFISLSVALLSDCLCHRWLDVHFRSSNPFKIIFAVLNYARKTKYPENRSAFTYIDEEEPSRLDYGKDKFGGPFTEEEVEDVKTVFRLLPLFLTSFGAFITNNFIQNKDPFQTHVIPTPFHSELQDCVGCLRHMLLYLSAVILLPIYRFTVSPLLRNRIPSLIKRGAAGLVFCCLGILFNLTLDTVGHLHSNSTIECMFVDNRSTNTIPIPFYWLILSDLVIGIATGFVFCTSMEFIMAQSPNRMRGVMMGLAVMMLSFGSSIHHGLQLFFKHYFPTATPSCGFYYYLVLSILLILSLVLFTIAGKRYKLRERERHVNIQAIAEEHYERYLDQEEEYRRENNTDNITVISS